MLPSMSGQYSSAVVASTSGNADSFTSRLSPFESIWSRSRCPLLTTVPAGRVTRTGGAFALVLGTSANAARQSSFLSGDTQSKSILGEELNASEVTKRGVLGDRAYALVDSADGKVASAKNRRKWPGLLLSASSVNLAPAARRELRQLPTGRQRRYQLGCC
jgi:hypothetical protein